MIDQPRRRSGTAWVASGTSVAVLGLVALAATGAPAMHESVEPPPPVAETIHVCSSCHGFRGRSTSSLFPVLAGQQKNYIETQLKAFRDHSRADPHAEAYMWGMAARLTDAQISLIADYYGAQQPVYSHADPSPQVAAGAQIYTEGVPFAKVPACMNCHGKKAEGDGKTPRLAGQHPDYLVRQLEWFASMARASQVMYESSMNLTAEQIAAVAAYLGSQ